MTNELLSPIHSKQSAAKKLIDQTTERKETKKKPSTTGRAHDRLSIVCLLVSVCELSKLKPGARDSLSKRSPHVNYSLLACSVWILLLQHIGSAGVVIPSHGTEITTVEWNYGNSAIIGSGSEGWAGFLLVNSFSPTHGFTQSYPGYCIATLDCVGQVWGFIEPLFASICPRDQFGLVARSAHAWQDWNKFRSNHLACFWCWNIYNWKWEVIFLWDSTFDKKVQRKSWKISFEDNFFLPLTSL